MSWPSVAYPSSQSNVDYHQQCYDSTPPPPRPTVMTPPQLPTSDVRRHGSDNKLLRAQEAFLAQFLAHLLLGLRSATTTSLQTRRTLWFEAEGSGYGSNDEIEEEQDEDIPPLCSDITRC
eukprot:scaffold11755_cov165-Ochromonas_danica.AAC.1